MVRTARQTRFLLVLVAVTAAWTSFVEPWALLPANAREPQEDRAVVMALAEALKDQDAAVRKGAAQSLGRLGAKAIDALPALVAAVADMDVDVRGAAALTPGRMGKEAREAVPALTDLLRDADRQVRSAAALSLARIGPEARARLRHF
jgi:HEAT repeat protein